MSKVRDDGYYYDFGKDLEAHPDTWCYLIFGGRNTGKTYSALRRATETNNKFVFLRRTKKDIERICTGGSKKARDLGINMDTSPFFSLNRDFGWNIRPFLLDDIGVFCHCDGDNLPVHGKEPVGYMLSLGATTDFKGIDMSYVNWIIFDEFVPKAWDRKMREEGDAVMELYKTISRDREHRDLPALKLIGLANAANAASPLTEVLEVTDDVVEMSFKREAVLFNEKRDIFLRRVIDNEDFKKKERQSRIYRSMAGTRWAAMALDNEFGYNDFSQVNSFSLKRANPCARFKFKNDNYYIYVNPSGVFLLSKKPFVAKTQYYNLNLEADQITFFYEWVVPLLEAASEHRCQFETYTLSRIIYEYRNYFKLKG